jgi:hypothetical protein
MAKRGFNASGATRKTIVDTINYLAPPVKGIVRSRPQVFNKTPDHINDILGARVRRIMPSDGNLGPGKLTEAQKTLVSNFRKNVTGKNKASFYDKNGNLMIGKAVMSGLKYNGKIDVKPGSKEWKMLASSVGFPNALP